MSLVERETVGELSPDDPRHRSAYRFVIHEAQLVDQHEYDAWYALWEPDATYWVPVNPAADYVLGRTVSIIRDDHERLRERVERLKNPAAHSQIPPSRTCRLVGSAIVSAVDDTDDVVVNSNVIIDEVRRGFQTIYSGRVVHHLRPRQDSTWGLVSKTVRLTQASEALGNLTFLL